MTTLSRGERGDIILTRTIAIAHENQVMILSRAVDDSELSDQMLEASAGPSE